MKKTITLLALVLLTTTFTFAQTVIWNNMASFSKNFWSPLNTTYGMLGQQFKIISPNTSLEEIVLPLIYEGADANFTVSIYTDNGSNQIGTKLVDIYSSTSTTLPRYDATIITNLTLNASKCNNNSLPLNLTAGNSYWVIIVCDHPIASTGVYWYYDFNSNPLTGTGASMINYTNYAYYTDCPFYMTLTAGVPQPAVTSVTVPANKTYKIGDALNFTVNYDQNVTVTGTPQLPITLNTGGTVNASYVSGSGTSALVFSYTVVSGNLDADGIAVGSALSLNGGTIKNGATTDASLTLNSVGATTNVKIDGIRPTATITMSDVAIRIGETSTLTFTFSEAVTGFTTADLTVANGSVTGLTTSNGGLTWTATFTPSASVTVATNVITLDNSGVTDAAGNAGTSSTTSPNYAIDTARPTAAIAMSDAAIKVGETATVTFTFSEAVTGFSNADLTIFNGTLTAVSSGDGGITWTATFTPSASVTVATNVITLDNTGVTDAAGNAGTSTTSSPNYAIDTALPTATITSTTAVITYATQIPVTVTFSEAVTGFISSDVTVTNGTLNTFAGSGATYTFTVTPSTQGLVTVAIAGSVAQDLAGNNNVAATSLTRTFDSVNPTVVLSTTASEPTNLTSIPVKLTFSEAVTGLVLTDFTVVNATLSALSGSGTTYTLTATPTAQGTVTISLGSGMVLDVAQLGNVASNQLNRTFDNVPPALGGVANGQSYTSTQAVTFTEGSATLTKNGGLVNAYTSGTAIGATGSYVVMVTDAAGNSNSVSFTITITTGINEQHETSLLLYPTPCTDGFNVSGIDEPADVTITDLTGRVVVKTVVEVDGYVSMGDLKQGTYLVKVNQRVLKLIKK